MFQHKHCSSNGTCLQKYEPNAGTPEAKMLPMTSVAIYVYRWVAHASVHPPTGQPTAVMTMFSVSVVVGHIAMTPRHPHTMALAETGGPPVQDCNAIGANVFRSGSACSCPLLVLNRFSFWRASQLESEPQGELRSLSKSG